MKKFLTFILIATMFTGLLAAPVSAAYLSESSANFPVYITEVCADPSKGDANSDLGQYIEIYNNTDAQLDLYDYELMITTGRDVGKQFVGQFAGLVTVSAEKGVALLEPGEVALVWLLYKENHKAYDADEIRAAMATLGTPVNGNTKIFIVDTTDADHFSGTENYIDTNTRYIMVNERGTYDKNKGQALAAWAQDDGTGRGAYVRVYGTKDGMSLNYGLTPNSSNKKVLNWQSDFIKEKTYTSPTPGYLYGEKDGEKLGKQSEIFKSAVTHIPGINEPAVETETSAPTTSESGTDAPTQNPVTGDSATVFMTVLALSAVACLVFAIVPVVKKKRN